MLPATEVELDGQAMQLADPNPALYVPAKHSEHVSPFCPVYPALHLHAVCMLLVATDIELDGHDAQSEGPDPTLYVPAKHSEHVLPFAPVYPALH
jgi:hypothetical protein